MELALSNSELEFFACAYNYENLYLEKLIFIALKQIAQPYSPISYNTSAGRLQEIGAFYFTSSLITGLGVLVQLDFTIMMTAAFRRSVDQVKYYKLTLLL